LAAIIVIFYLYDKYSNRPITADKEIATTEKDSHHQAGQEKNGTAIAENEKKETVVADQKVFGV
jgi:hypothetical protein